MVRELITSGGQIKKFTRSHSDTPCEVVMTDTSFDNLKISCNGQSDANKLREMLKPYCGHPQHDLKRCRVKIDYHNDLGHVELLLGREWQVDLHDELIDGLTQWLSEENVKILYN